MTPTLTDADVEKYVREIAAQEHAKLNKTEETVHTAPEPFTLTIAGKEMTFKDQAEASAVLTSVYEEQAKRPAPQQASVGRTVTNDEGPAWTPEDQSRYVDLLVKNPIAAQELIDERRFGFKNPTEVIKQQMQATQNMTTQLTIDQFVSQHKDYHVSPENAAAMQTVLTELGGGRPVINPMALEAAYAIADKRGLLKRPETENKTQGGYNPYLTPPPTSGRNTSHVSSSFERDAENMSLEAIENLFMRNQ